MTVCVLWGDKPIEALWAIKRTFSRLSRSRYEGPRYEIVFPRKLTLDFVSIFAQDDFIFFGFFVSFFFKYFITVDMVYTTATLVAPTALPSLSISLSRCHATHSCCCLIVVGAAFSLSLFQCFLRVCACLVCVCTCVCVWQHYRYDLQSLALSMTRRVYTKLARNFNLI